MQKIAFFNKKNQKKSLNQIKKTVIVIVGSLFLLNGWWIWHFGDCKIAFTISGSVQSGIWGLEQVAPFLSVFEGKKNAHYTSILSPMTSISW